MRAIKKQTVIAIGMIVILSLTLPAVAGSGGEDERPRHGEELPDTEAALHAALQEVLEILYGHGLIANPESPLPSTPVLPQAPALPGAPENPNGPGPDPSQLCPLDLVSFCQDEPADETPEEERSPEPEPASPEEQAPQFIEQTVDRVTALVPSEEEAEQKADGLLVAILNPVQAAAKGASDGARIVVAGVVQTAGHVTDEAAEQVYRQTARGIALTAFLLGMLDEVLENILPGSQTAATTAPGEMETLGTSASQVAAPANLLALSLLAAGSLSAIAGALIGLRRLVGFGGAALLSRIPSKDIMKNDTRASIFDIVTHDPGVSLNEIVDRLGLSRNAIAYHLAVFESEKQIVSVKDGKYRRYFINGGKYVNGAKDVVSTIKNDVTLNVIRFIMENPGAMQKEVCTAVGTSPSATNWHINRLEKVGLVEKTKVANTVRYAPGPSFSKYDLADFGLGMGTLETPSAPVPIASPA